MVLVWNDLSTSDMVWYYPDQRKRGRDEGTMRRIGGWGSVPARELEDGVPNENSDVVNELVENTHERTWVGYKPYDMVNLDEGYFIK